MYELIALNQSGRKKRKLLHSRDEAMYWFLKWSNSDKNDEVDLIYIQDEETAARVLAA